MKNKKYKILILAIAALMTQSTFAFAEGEKKDYSREDMENIQPGYGWEDIYKSQYKVNTSVNSYSSEETPKQVSERLGDQTGDKATTTTADATATANSGNQLNTIVKTQPSTGVAGSYWGKTSGGKWMLFENYVPVTGWKTVNGSWYYMDLEGIMQTGWMDDGTNWYYLYPSGVMASNTYVGGYYLDWNGVMQ